MTFFVSYSSLDGDAVKTFVQHLEGAGHKVFMDHEVPIGEDWWVAILRQIRECEIFIVALSQNALDSKPCQLEIGYAQELGLPILPVQIGEVGSYRLDPIFTHQLVDYRNPTVVTGFALTKALSDCVATRKPLPHPLPAEPPIPFEYLLRLGKVIRGTESISNKDQREILDQLRLAWRDETDATVRSDIRRLMQALRNRSDVAYLVVEDIDRALDEKPRPAGWYPDPAGSKASRYWDGTKWTTHFHGGDGGDDRAPVEQPRPAGWYPDPSGAKGYRYWDGSCWTYQHNVGVGAAAGKVPEAAVPRPEVRHNVGPQSGGNPTPNPVRPQPGPVTAPTPPVSGQPPDNNLVLAIITTVLCCIPVGIAGIVYASRVNPLWAQGRHDEARQAAANAQKFVIWTVVAGVVYYGVMIILYATGAIK